MIFLGLLAAYFTLFSAGLGVTLMIFRRAARINLFECCCLSWLFGTGIVSILLWICGTFLSGFILQITVTGVCIVLGASGWRSVRSSKLVLPLPRGLLEWLLAIILVLEIGAVLFVSGKHTLGWDGLLVWEIKARYAFINGGSIPASYYSSGGRGFSHPEYPLGIPFIELWLYLWMGQPHQFWVKTIFGIFYAVGTILLALLATRLSGRRWSGLLVAILLPFVPFLTSAPGGVIVAYADFPLSVFYLAALGYLSYWFAKGDSKSFIVYAVCVALLPWIKREGIILWCVLVLLGSMASWRQKKLSQFGIWLLPGVAIIASWRVYLTLIHCIPLPEFAFPRSGKLFENAARVGPICRLLLAEMSSQADWSIFWLAAAVAMLYLVIRFNDTQSWMLVSAIIMPIALYCAIYLFSNWPNYAVHVSTSLPRLLLHVVPTTLLAIATVLPFKPIQLKTMTGSKPATQSSLAL
jgi:hypothetical protein